MRLLTFKGLIYQADNFNGKVLKTTLETGEQY